jgi:UPF0042 nucleotide-binding protein
MGKKIRLLLVSGVSGAGKTTFASVCEERGFYVIEDLPLSMIPSLLEVFKNEPATYEKVAVFVGISHVQAAAAICHKDSAFETTVVGLDCSLEVLMTRFRLTRHIHPLQPKGFTLEEALQADAQAMREAKPFCDLYIDTSGLSEKELRKEAAALLLGGSPKLTVIISSFGYKYGLPRDAEIVLDSRALANPYWVKELSHLTGLDQPVIDYIEKDPKTPIFLNKVYSLLEDYLAHAQEEGRAYAFIDVGCSGGQHRSVFVAEKIYEHFKTLYPCSVSHRELARYLEDEKD